MELAGLKVVLDGDVTKLEAALARGTEYLKSYAKYAQDMFKGIKIDVSNIQGATQAQKDAADAAYKLAQAKLAEARADKIRFDMANKTESQKKREKDLYGELVAQNNAIVREYYNAAAAVAKYGESSGISAAKLEELRVAAQRGQQQLREIEQGAGRFQRNVGNYASAFNPLQNSINQLSREMPAFANSVQTGFMAISNNLPILADSLSQIVAQNNALRAQGQPTVSVARQLAGAFFSWNTALSVGITLLTVYGKDLVNWIRGSKQAEEAQKRLNEEKKKEADIDRQANNRAGEQIANLRVLVATLESTTTSYKAKQGALKKLQETWPSYFSNLDMAAVKNGKLAQQVQQLTNDILASARAMAAMNKIVANEQDILNAQQQENDLRMKFSQGSVKLNNLKRDIAQRTTSPDPATTSGAYMAVGPGIFGKSLSAQENEIKQYKAQIDDLVSYKRKKAQENNELLSITASTNTGRLSMDGTDAAKFNGKTKSTKDEETPLQKLSKDLQQIDVEKSRNIITALDALNQQLAAYEDFLKATATGKNALPNDNAFVQSAMSNIERLKTAIAQAELEVRPKIAPIGEEEISKLDESIKASAKTITITVKPVLDKTAVDEAALQAENLGKEIVEKLKEQFTQAGIEIGQSIGESIGDIMSGDGTLASGLKRWGDVLSNLLSSIGKMLIETGVKVKAAQIAAKGLAVNPVLAIGVGVATVAAAKILKNNINSSSRGVRFADGGIVYGRTQALVGEYSNARSNPEIIAPLDKLSAKLREVGFNRQSQPLSVEVTGKISGQDILLSTKRTQAKEF